MYIFSLALVKGTLMRSLTVAFFIVIALGMVSGIAQAKTSSDIDGSSFSIEPFYNHLTHQIPRPYFVYTMRPYTQIQDAVHVQNNSQARGSLKLYPIDAFTNQTSGMSFRANKDPRHDVGAWISPQSKIVTLNPGQSVDVPFQLDVPPLVRPGEHFGGIVAEPVYQQTIQSTQRGGTTFGVHILSLTILGVQVNIPGNITEQLRATHIRYDSQSQYQRVLLTLANTGTQLIHPAGTLQILNLHGELLQNIPLKLQAFLPQTSIDYPIYMKHRALALGQMYQARLQLQYEYDHTLNYMASFNVPLPPKILSIPVPPAISSLVAAPTMNSFFSQLTPVHFIIAAILLLSIFTALLSWTRRIFKATRTLRRRFSSLPFKQEKDGISQTHEEPTNTCNRRRGGSM